MKSDEILAFTNAMNVMREMWGLPSLSKVALDQYWQRLIKFNSDQFTNACRKLMEKSKNEFSKGFPLPGDFIEAMAPDPEEVVTKKWADQIPEGPTAKIIQRILPLMPDKGKYYDNQQAADMVTRMNEIVDEEFKKQRLGK
jgi:hypothetical protein